MYSVSKGTVTGWTVGGFGGPGGPGAGGAGGWLGRFGTGPVVGGPVGPGGVGLGGVGGLGELCREALLLALADWDLGGVG